MKIGVPKEIKKQEYRVSLTPEGAHALCFGGHQVLVQKGAGIGSGFRDDEYEKAGAKLVTQEQAWSDVDIVVKVKEPIAEEFPFFREDLTLFTYLHLAAAQTLGKELLKSKMTAIAYETIEEDEKLPLLTPMSAVAGRMATQVGATFLQRENGGKGCLLGGVTGTPRGNVVVIGGGIVGANAIQMAVGLGANVTVLDIDHETLAYLDDIHSGKIQTLYSTQGSIANAVAKADLVIGAVLVTGAKAPKLVTREMLKPMEKGSVIVDVAVDQGGCVETTRPTTHAEPTFIVDDVIHYCVANMPGAVPHTSTRALTNATFPYLRKLANLGVDEAIAKSPAIQLGVNTIKGTVPHAAVAQSLAVEATPL